MNHMLSRLILFAASSSIAVRLAQPRCRCRHRCRPVPPADCRLDGTSASRSPGPPRPRLARAGSRFLAQLSTETGIPITRRPRRRRATLSSTAPRRTDKPVDKLGDDEAYRLEITSPRRASHRRPSSAPCAVCKPCCNSSSSDRRASRSPPSPSTTPRASPGEGCSST